MSYFFAEIINTGKWQKIQDYFSQVLGIYLRTVDTSWQALTSPSGSSRLCDEINRMVHSEENSLCRDCVPRDIKTIEKNWQQGYECIEGVYIYPIPLRVKDEIVAYIIVGPVIVGKPRTKEAFAGVVRRLGIDEGNFFDVLRDTKAFTFVGIQSVLELLADIGRYVGEVGYTNLRLRKLLPSLPSELDSLNEFYLERILKALLDVSCQVLKADRGSIMLLDPSGGELYIKSARGLPADIVRSARVRVGEGISGLVADIRQPLLIFSGTDDPKIRSRLRNPQLTYALSVPIQTKDQFLGVLNIATGKDNPEHFKGKSLETIGTLTRLVQETLSDLPGITPQ